MIMLRVNAKVRLSLAILEISDMI